MRQPDSLNRPHLHEEPGSIEKAGAQNDADRLEAFGIHGGVRNVWDTPEDDDTFRAYGGLEVQLPLRLYVVGEVRTDDNAATTPYAYGIQWRLGGINISVAGVQNGNFADDAFYFGIGSAMQF